MSTPTVYGCLSEIDLQQQAAQIRQQGALPALVALAKQAAPAPAELCQPQYEVRGCEAKVWLQWQWQQQRLQLQLLSPSRLVLGLLTLLQSALQGADAAQLRGYDLTAHLQALGLQQFVSQSRRDGLQAVVRRLQQEALGTPEEPR